jgi:hypothetical protein
VLPSQKIVQRVPALTPGEALGRGGNTQSDNEPNPAWRAFRPRAPRPAFGQAAFEFKRTQKLAFQWLTTQSLKLFVNSIEAVSNNLIVKTPIISSPESHLSHGFT